MTEPHPPGAAPLAPGSISLRLYPHNELPADQIVANLLEQARLATDGGFDGVMTSEHHAGFAGYLPNPLQVAGWILDSMPTGWAAACPLLLPLRPVAHVIEEVAWQAARFPGRVGLGVASGSLEADFTIMGTDKRDLTARFEAGLEWAAAALAGRDPGLLAGDRAVELCRDRPVPVVSAAMGFTAVRRAASHGVGLLFDSLSAPDRVRRLIQAYREAGGTEACILIRRAWVGPPPTELVERQVDVYRSYADRTAQLHWSLEGLVSGDDGEAVAGGLAAALVETGADALNLRVHVPDLPPPMAAEQIGRLAEEVVPLVRAAAGWDASTSPR